MHQFTICNLQSTNFCNPIRYSLYRLSLLWSSMKCYDSKGHELLWKDCKVLDTSCIAAKSSDAYMAYTLLGTYKAPIIQLNYTAPQLTITSSDSAEYIAKELQTIPAWTRYE